MSLKEVYSLDTKKFLAILILTLVIFFITQSNSCKICIGCKCYSLYGIEKPASFQYIFKTMFKQPFFWNYVISFLLVPILLYILATPILHRLQKTKPRKKK